MRESGRNQEQAVTQPSHPTTCQLGTLKGELGQQLLCSWLASVYGVEELWNKDVIQALRRGCGGRVLAGKWIPHLDLSI